MSYDPMVFDPKIVPRERAAFMAWYRDPTKWEGERDYNQPYGMPGNLGTFHKNLREEFPPMNGPHAVRLMNPPQSATASAVHDAWSNLSGRQRPAPPQDPADRPMVTDYSIGSHAIYIAFSSSGSRTAYNCVFKTAMSTGVGCFDASADDRDILHDIDQMDDLMGL